MKTMIWRPSADVPVIKEPGSSVRATKFVQAPTSEGGASSSADPAPNAVAVPPAAGPVPAVAAVPPALPLVWNITDRGWLHKAKVLRTQLMVPHLPGGQAFPTGPNPDNLKVSGTQSMPSSIQTVPLERRRF